MRHLLLIISLLAAMTVHAQNKLDNEARNLPDSLPQTYNVIVIFNSQNVDFGEYKADIVSQLDNMAVVNATASQMKEIAALPQVQSVSLGSEVRPLDVKSTYTTANIQAEEPKNDKKNGHRTLKNFFLNIFKKIGLAK